MKSMLLYVLGAFLLAALALGAAWLLQPSTVDQGAAAFALAFVPGAATLAPVILGFRSKPDLMMLAFFAGTGVRMVVAAGGGYLLTHAWPETFAQPFWNWLILFYLGLLALEVTLLVSAFHPPSVLPGVAEERANHDSRGNA